MRRLTPWLLTPLLLSCGDALVDGHYKGAPVFALSGEIVLPSEQDYSAQYACEEALRACVMDAPDLCQEACADYAPEVFDVCITECEPGFDCPMLCDEQLNALMAEGAFGCPEDEQAIACEEALHLFFTECVDECHPGELECEARCEETLNEALEAGLEPCEAEQGWESCREAQALFFDECLMGCDIGTCHEHCETLAYEPSEVCQEIERSGEGVGCDACAAQLDDCLAEARSEATPWVRRPEALRVGLFWLGVNDNTERIEQTVDAAARFPATYELKLHAPPPKQALRRFEGAKEQGALGLILVYLDEDEDGRWTPEKDQLVGGTGETALLYAPEGLERGEEAWEPGYHLVHTEVRCEGGGADGLQFWQAEAKADVRLSTNTEDLKWLTFHADCADTNHICPPWEELQFLCGGPEIDPWLCEYCGAAQDT